MPTELGHDNWIWILALVAILALALYLRGRRLIGHQRYSERRLLVRIAILVIAILLVLFARLQHGNLTETWAGIGAGFAVGVIIALLAIRLTRMGRGERGIWYVPNLYLGVGLIALLIARFVYEYVVVLPALRKAAAAGSTVVLTGYASTAMLNGVLFLVLGYFLVYYLGIVLRAHRLESEPAPGEDTDE